MMKYQQAKDIIKEAINIVDVISDFINLKKKGINYVGLCPFHNDRHESFSVSPNRQIYKCFACGSSGDVYQFLMDHENMTFFQAVQYCGNRVGISVEDTESDTPEQREQRKHKESLLIAINAATDYYQKQLSYASTYLSSRGYTVDDDIIKTYKVGYAPEGNIMQKELRSKGYREELLEEVNLIGQGKYGKYDIFQGRVMFPFLDIQGNTIGFTGRILEAKDNVAKYSNTRETPLFNKGSHLFGMYQARRSMGKMECAYLVEGQFDVISLAAVGVTNAVASSGTALTETQVRLLSKYTRTVVLNYDGDAAGQKACLRTASMMLKMGLNVKCIILPAGKDPDDIAREHGDNTKMYLQNKTCDIVTYYCEMKHPESIEDPIEKEKCLQEITELISCCQVDSLRYSYVKKLAERFAMAKDIVISKVKGFLKKQPKVEKEDLKPGVYGLDVIDTNLPDSVHITADWDEFMEGYGERQQLYIHEKLSMTDIQELRRKCPLMDVDDSDISIDKHGVESTVMAAMSECYQNGITEISVYYSAETQSADSEPDTNSSADDYINESYKDETWTFLNFYVYRYYKWMSAYKPYDSTAYVQRCAALIACAEDSVRIVNFNKYTNWLSLTKTQLNAILKPYLSKKKSRVAFNSQREGGDTFYNYDPDTLPDYVENDPVYSAMYKDHRFYPLLNQEGIPISYVFANGNDKGHKIVADFFMEPLLHVQSDVDDENRRVVKINRKRYKQPIYLEIPSKAFIKKSSIEERLIMLEAVNFTDGEEIHWRKIKEWMSYHYVTCKEIKVYGNQQVDGVSRKEDNMFFAFANGIFHKVDDEWRFEPVTEMGVVTHNKKNYYLPAFSSIYADSDSQEKYELISTLVYKEVSPAEQCSFEKWADLMDRVYKMNDNGKWALIYAVMCAFRINIFQVERNFTAPFFMGPMSSGKTQIAISIRSLFMSPRVPIFNLNFGTDAAMSTMMSTFRDVPVVLDEYNNKDISDTKFQALKDIVYDGSGKQKRRGTSSREIENDKVYTPVVICGQETPQRDDNSLMSRIIVCEVSKPGKQRTQEEVDLFNELKEIEERGLSNVLLEVLKLRPLVMDKFRVIRQECYKELKSHMTTTGEVDRLMKTISLFLATCKLLKDYTELKLPFSYEEFFQLALDKIHFQIELISKTDKLASFFTAMNVMIDTKAIIEGRDFAIEEKDMITIKTPGGGRNEASLPLGTKVLFIRVNSVYSQYARSSYNREESTLSTIEQNLRSSPAYIGMVNSKRFKWQVTEEVPKGGDTADADTMVKKITEQSTTSSCAAINYDMFRSIYDIDLQRSAVNGDDIHINENEDPNKQTLDI